MSIQEDHVRRPGGSKESRECPQRIQREPSQGTVAGRPQAVGIYFFPQTRKHDRVEKKDAHRNKSVMAIGTLELGPHPGACHREKQTHEPNKYK